MPEQYRRSQQWEIVQALLQRVDLANQAQQSFRGAYPDAPSEMVQTAVFHTYVDGIGAVIDWLVDLELFLRDSSHLLNLSVTSHVLYHLYNWHQLSTLLPGSKPDVLERLKDIKALAMDGETEEILAIVAELEEIFAGNQIYPDSLA